MNIRGRNKILPNLICLHDGYCISVIIFFMIASTLVTTNAIDILLPTASGKTENKKSIAVSIKKDLTYYIDQRKWRKI